MGKKKPCKPKPKAIREFNMLWKLLMESPKLAHVLCPVHVK